MTGKLNLASQSKNQILAFYCGTSLCHRGEEFKIEREQTSKSFPNEACLEELCTSHRS